MGTKKTVVAGQGPSKFAPKKTSREDVHVAVGNALGDLKDQSQALLKLISSLENTMRGDVSVSTVEETKQVLSTIDTTRKHVVTLRDTLKSRVRTRLNEI